MIIKTTDSKRIFDVRLILWEPDGCTGVNLFDELIDADFIRAHDVDLDDPRLPILATQAEVDAIAEGWTAEAASANRGEENDSMDALTADQISDGCAYIFTVEEA